MKKHNTLKIVLITILVLVLLTWIFPAAYFQTSYVSQGRVQMGLFDLFNYQITTVQYFGYIALFVLVVGGFYGVLNATGAYRTLLDKIVSKFKGKEKIVLSVIMVLLAILTSVCGMQLALIAIIPFLISLILLMGYNKITAALTTVGAIMVGIAGTTFGYTTTSILNTALSLGNDSEIVTKIIILVVGLVLLIFNTLKFAGTKEKGSKKKEEKSELEMFVPEAAKGKKKKVWPLVVIFSIIMVIMILSLISWTGAFNLKAFDSATTAVTGFKLFGFAIFGKILGTVNAFGSWTITEIGILLVLSSLIIKFIYGIKFDEYLDAIASGVKKAIKPALLVILIYSCLVIVTYHPFQLTIYKGILGLTKGFNVFTSGIVAILASLINVEGAYTFQSVVPYLTSLVSDKTVYPIIYVMFQSIYGVVMLVAPTSVILMGVLSYLDIPYTKWLKAIWKLLLELIVVLFIIFTILVLI